MLRFRIAVACILCGGVAWSGRVTAQTTIDPAEFYQRFVECDRAFLEEYSFVAVIHRLSDWWIPAEGFRDDLVQIANQPDLCASSLAVIHQDPPVWVEPGSFRFDSRHDRDQPLSLSWHWRASHSRRPASIRARCPLPDS